MRFVISCATVLLCAAASAPAQNHVTRVSVNSSGVAATWDADAPRLSGDGRWVAFSSPDPNLVANDTNWTDDVFVHDLWTGATVRMSVDSSGAEAKLGGYAPSISYDGRFVSFASCSNDLVPNDTNDSDPLNGGVDVFLRDRDPDGNGVYDEGNATTVRVSVDSNGAQTSGGGWANCVSGDGTRVAFVSYASDLVPGDLNQRADVFVHDLVTGATTRVDVDSNGAEANRGVADTLVVISRDGGVVLFSSASTNLVGGDLNHTWDAFVHDLASGVTERVSVASSGAEAGLDAWADALTADGSLVLFESNAVGLDPAFPGRGGVYLRDRVAGTTKLVSTSTAGVAADGSCYDACISADGRHVAFRAENVTNLLTDEGSAASVTQIVVKDLASGHLSLVSASVAGTYSDRWNHTPTISDDGAVVAFASTSDDLVVGDVNGTMDVFVFDGTGVALASRASYGVGLAGTLGVPSLDADVDPVLGASVTLTLGNSVGAPTVGFLFTGHGRAAIPIRGGLFLVDSLVSVLPVALAPTGTTVAFDLPVDPALEGELLDTQLVEFDAGAPRGLAFSAGLETVVGR
jgi:Tol biopolymer transport system component